MEFKKFDPSDDVLDEFNLKVTEDAAACFRLLDYIPLFIYYKYYHKLIISSHSKLFYKEII